VSAYSGALETIDRVLNRGSDADEVLRQVVDVLHGIDHYSWVGISFVEEGELVHGPERGKRTAEPTKIPISYEDNVVAELGVIRSVVKAEDRAFLEHVALVISPYCLVGWDTGGEAWSP
jgi:putative methionine-R-sulfoxide reductase with GAF domain